MLGSNALNKGGLSPNALGYALMLACVVASYTVIDGLGARASHNALSYAVYTQLINGVFMWITAKFILKLNIKEATLTQWKISVFSGLLSLIAYGIVLYAMTKAEIALVSAVREISVLFATAIGWWILKESISKIHIFAAVIIVAGLALIKL